MRQGGVKKDITEKRKEETKRERHKRERRDTDKWRGTEGKGNNIEKRRRKDLEQIFPVRNKEKTRNKQEKRRS